MAIFDASEESTSYVLSYNEIKGSWGGAKMDFSNTIFPLSTTTSWSLAKIIFPNKEEINFEYQYKEYPFYPIVTAMQYYFNPIVRYVGQRTDQTIPPKFRTVYQSNIVEGQCYLKGIRWKSGYIDFETGERKDFCSLKDPKAPSLCPKLDKMKVYRNNETTPLREFVFHESYFSNPEKPLDHNNLRLRLDSLSVCANTIRDVYKFGYDTRYPLPPKYSYAQDLWGYRNGNGEEWLYPIIELSKDYTYIKYYANRSETITVYRKGQILAGAQRQSSPSYITSAMLTSIESPEGAVTTYTYEANEASIKASIEKAYTSKNLYQKAFGREVEEYAVYLPQKSWVELNFVYNGNVVAPLDDKYKHEMVSLKSADGSFSKTYGINDFADLAHFDYTIKKDLECPAGHYTLTLRSSNVLSQQAELLCFENVEKPELCYGGGVRIAKITSPLSTREFVYKDDSDSIGSGVFIRNPFHVAEQIINEYTGEGLGILKHSDYYIVQQSSPVYPLESAASNTAVGYKKVKVITRSSGRTTEEAYYYGASKEKVNLTYRGLPGECIYLNGKLLKHITYLDGKMQQKTVNEYEELTVDSLNALYQEPYEIGEIVAYKIPVVHCRLKKTTSEIYDPQTSAVNRTVTTYNNYNAMNYLPSVVTVENGLDKRVTETTYSVDLKNNSASYNEMCGYQQITTPVEVKTYVNGTLSKKELHEYMAHPTHPIYVPYADFSYYYDSGKPVTNFDGNNSWLYGFPDVTYTQYDDCNNCIEIRTRTGQSTVYLWGYNKQYPIAQIFNATLDELKAAGIKNPVTFSSGITPTISEWRQLHELRYSLPKASVSVFQYDPLVGVTTVTDPRGMNTYYEYDAMGRLVVERDHERNIIRTYHYTLKNER